MGEDKGGLEVRDVVLAGPVVRAGSHRRAGWGRVRSHRRAAWGSCRVGGDLLAVPRVTACVCQTWGNGPKSEGA